MFEDSLMESGGKIKSKSRYWMIATFTFNGIILIAMILVPLLYPEALPRTSLMASLTAPPPPPPPPPPPAPKVKIIPIAHEIDQGLHAPTKIPHDIDMVKDAPPPPTGGVAGVDGMGGAPGGVLGGFGSGPAIHVAPPKPTGPVRISGGVVAGNRTAYVEPQYPPIAKIAHLSGTVVLRAIISKTGAVVNLEVSSSTNPMFNNAAMDAVKQWKYKPYLLNNEPTDVDTTITVNFALNGG
jgi:protein TonB